MMSFAQSARGRSGAIGLIMVASLASIGALMGQSAPEPQALPHPDAIRPAFLACAGVEAEEARVALASETVSDAVAAFRAARVELDAANAALREERARVWREGGEFSETIVNRHTAAKAGLDARSATLDQAINDAITPYADQTGMILARRGRAQGSTALPSDYAVLDLSGEALMTLAQAKRLHGLGKELSGAHAAAFDLAERSPNVLLARQRLAAYKPALEELWCEACVGHGLVEAPEEPGS